MNPSWIDANRDIPIAEVAARLGIEAGPLAGGRPTYECPACGAATRHTRSNDKRGAVGLSDSLAGWECFQCSQKGDSVDFVSWRIAGARFRDLPPDDKARVREFFTGDATPPAWRENRAPRREVVEIAYPDAGEVAALWKASMPVSGDAEVRAYLEKRRLDPGEIEVADLCRALPIGAALPPWARGPEGNWLETGHRLVVPLFDAAGVMRSLVGRAIGGARPKSLAPARHSRKELLFAEGLALHVLKTGGLPARWACETLLRCILAEGEADYLSLTMSKETLTSGGSYPTCLGLIGGAIPVEVVDKLPTGTEVIIAEQRDEPRDDGKPTAAQEYTARILKQLSARIDKGELSARVVAP